MTTPKDIAIVTCPRGHTFEDFVSVIEDHGGWCPTCDAPVSRINLADRPDVGVVSETDDDGYTAHWAVCATCGWLGSFTSAERAERDADEHRCEPDAVR